MFKIRFLSHYLKYKIRQSNKGVCNKIDLVCISISFEFEWVGHFELFPIRGIVYLAGYLNIWMKQTYIYRIILILYQFLSQISNHWVTEHKKDQVNNNHLQIRTFEKYLSVGCMSLCFDEKQSQAKEWNESKKENPTKAINVDRFRKE